MSEKNKLTPEQIKGLENLRAEAKKLNMTFEEFLNGPIRKMLDAAWKLQQEKGAPVKIDDLVEELNKQE